MVKSKFFIRGRSVAVQLTNYLQTFIKISGWEVLLFLKIDNFSVKPLKID